MAGPAAAPAVPEAASGPASGPVGVAAVVALVQMEGGLPTEIQAAGLAAAPASAVAPDPARLEGLGEGQAQTLPLVQSFQSLRCNPT